MALRSLSNIFESLKSCRVGAKTAFERKDFTNLNKRSKKKKKSVFLDLVYVPHFASLPW